MEAETGPVHHLAHGPGLVRVRGGGRVRGLPQHEDGLVLHLAADVEAGGHLPAAPPQPGQEAAQEPPGLGPLLPVGPPGGAAQLELLAAVVTAHRLDTSGPGLLDHRTHAGINRYYFEKFLKYFNLM